MARDLITQAEFARRIGIKTSSVSQLTKKQLKAAMVRTQIDWVHPDTIFYRLKKADAAPISEAAAEAYAATVEEVRRTGRLSKTYIQQLTGLGRPSAYKLHDAIVALEGQIGEPLKGQAAVNREASRQELPPPDAAPAGSDAQIPQAIQAYADMTLREVIRLYGTDQRFLEWLKATKEIEAIQANRIKNAEKVGELVNRDLIKKNVLDVLDGAFTRMLTDGAKSIAAQAHTMSKADMTVEEVEQMVSKQLTTFIRPTKSKMARGVRDA